METLAPIAFMLIVSFIVIFVSRKDNRGKYVHIRRGSKVSFKFGAVRVIGFVVDYKEGTYELCCDELYSVRMAKVFVNENLVTPL